MQPLNSFDEEIDVQLPITTLQELTDFEKKLQEIEFKNAVLNIFQHVGGHNAHIMIRNILRKTVTDTLAQNFSWAGKKTKESFQNLRIAQIIIQAVHKTFANVTDIPR
ncbi:hypothetical protein ALC60_05397 [Trachymyrmex zeteki]|nr:hypothetical protein ALC60_05397 [Trachymyrmex zeteki]